MNSYYTSLSTDVFLTGKADLGTPLNLDIQLSMLQWQAQYMTFTDTPGEKRNLTANWCRNWYLYSWASSIEPDRGHVYHTTMYPGVKRMIVIQHPPRMSTGITRNNDRIFSLLIMYLVVYLFFSNCERMLLLLLFSVYTPMSHTLSNRLIHDLY
jgi:hypothetical protein